MSIRHKAGSGAAGGLGAALASLGAELVPGAAYVLDAVGFDAAPFDLVVTGEGRVDATTGLGKAPGEVVRRAGATRASSSEASSTRRSTAPKPLRCRATRGGRGTTSSRWEET